MSKYRTLYKDENGNISPIELVHETLESAIKSRDIRVLFLWIRDSNQKPALTDSLELYEKRFLIQEIKD